MLKQISIILLILLLGMSDTNAQAPNQINYQGVARLANGDAIINQPIAIRISIRHAATNGAVQYSETRNVTTGSDGLFNLQIGSAGALTTTGSWSSITWDTGTKFVQVEMDAAGGTNFLNMGTQQLMSVPYAQHAKQAASLTPTATITPSQISAGGASTNDVLQFDGTNWIPSAPVPSTLALPYNQADPNLVSFAITNTSALGGSAIYGKTTTSNINATGVRGECTGNSGNGVSGKAAGTSSFGVLGQNTIGVAIKGISSGTGSIGVQGESGGTTGIGVKGTSNSVSAIGVFGESISGTGVKGYGNDTGSVAVFGSSLAGTGVKAVSFAGNALEVNGNLKISGGNTNPNTGSILMSDVNGNATWRNVKVAFNAGEVLPSSNTIGPNTDTKLKYHTKKYDPSNNFKLQNSSVDPSTFIAPVTGLYHFDARSQLSITSVVTNFNYAYYLIYVNGSSAAMVEFENPIITPNKSELYLVLNEDLHLIAGDKVDIRVYQDNTTNSSCVPKHSFFSGHLVYID